MFNIDRYLQKFSKNLNSLESDKKKIVDIINKNTNLKLEVSSIEIKNYVVIVETTRVGKSQLFINKNKILGEISGCVGTKISDIK